jgi:hypothetical protein
MNLCKEEEPVIPGRKKNLDFKTGDIMAPLVRRHGVPDLGLSLPLSLLPLPFSLMSPGEDLGSPSAVLAHEMEHAAFYPPTGHGFLYDNNE